MSNPKVTVLMPVYNGRKYLREAIDSILGQTFPDFEFLIIDDGSVDGSLKLIRSYDDSRIRVVIHERNQGLVATLNEGISLSSGEYIARMDCDDISLPERLAKQVELMDSDPTVAVCGTWAKSIDENGNAISLMRAPVGILLKYNFWKPSPMIHPSVMMRKSFFKDVLFSGDAANAEDYDLWLRTAKKHKIFNMKKYLLLYRVHDDSVSKKKRSEQLLSSHESFLKNFEIDGVSFEDFLVASSLSVSANPFGRLKIIFKIRKAIDYPLWFMILDDMAYARRWLLNKIK